MSALLSVALLVSAGLILALHKETTVVAGVASDDFAMAVTALALVVFMGGPVLRGHRGIVASLRDAVAWAALALVLITAYTVRNDLRPLADRVIAEFNAPVPVTVSTETAAVNRDVRIRRQVDGQFVATAAINDVAIAMIVDTGASTVVLRADDAKRAGIDLDALSYSVPVQTANGRSFAAHMSLSRVVIGTVTMTDVEALIARPGALHQSLLGMSFLSRLRSYEFSGDFLTMRG